VSSSPERAEGPAQPRTARSFAGEPISVDPAQLDLELVDEIERAGVQGWPPSFVDELSDGWILRATPGLDRGRLSHALTPRDRRLEAGELVGTLERVRSWSGHHGIRGGLQVAPLELHGDVVPGLVAAGWHPVWKCWVMAADRLEVLQRGARLTSGGVSAGGPSGAGQSGDERSGDPRSVGAPAPPWISARRPNMEWLATWEACQPSLSREAIDTHAATTFTEMGERGVFGRLGESATGVAVEDGRREWVGLFSLVVREDLRGRGLGRRLCLALLEEVQAPRVYLQVTMDNLAALALYRSLGFRAVHSYQHVQAPIGWSAGA
jgi:GNAT superfamily N-acetyltransferase